MKRATLRRNANSWAILIGCGLALARCGDDRVAGSSVTTGNPTEIQVGFTGDEGPMAVSGRIEIFAATQIPVPGFQPEPLARHEITGKTAFTLTAAHLEAIADSLWSPGSVVGDTLARFNLVVTAGERGAILRGLGYRLQDGEFILEHGDWAAGTDGAVAARAEIEELVRYQASLDSSELSAHRHHFLFLYGTGFYAENDNGTFVFPPMPEGEHSPAFFSIPTKESQATSPVDSINVNSISRPLATGPNPVDQGPATGRIRIPDALR